MATVSGSIVIRCPPEVVFDVVADEEREPAYNAKMLRVDKITDGPLGVGTRFRAWHAPRRRPVEMVVEYTEFVRPTRLASSSVAAWGDVVGELTLTPVGTSTRLQWTWEVRPNGFMRVLEPLIGVVGRRSERACWEGLRSYLESPERQPRR